MWVAIAIVSIRVLPSAHPYVWLNRRDMTAQAATVPGSVPALALICVLVHVFLSQVYMESNDE